MLSAVGEGRVEFGRKRCRRLDFYVGIVQRLRMYVAFILFYGQAVGKIILFSHNAVVEAKITFPLGY